MDTQKTLLTVRLFFHFALLRLDLFRPESILGRVVAHVLQVTLVKVLALLGYEEVYQVIVAFEVLSADEKKPLRLLALLVEHGVHAVLVEAVDQLDEIIL